MSWPVGPFYTEEDARRLSRERGWVVGEDSGRGWRCMVASPKPVEDSDDLFPTTRTHVRIIPSSTDNRRKLSTGETTVTQVISDPTLAGSRVQAAAFDQDLGQQRGFADHQIVTGVDGNQRLHAAERGDAAQLDAAE